MTMNPFDLIESPLDGVNLIEASAGTGKTYTIAGLYLRLVLEKGMTVEKILVVTFTEAATQELKERIRKRLKEAEICFETGETSDPLLAACLTRSRSQADDLERLRDAVRSFDQAAVFTIHGFCQRMLVENAFESGSLFETELVTDTSGLIREILQDFIRTHVYPMTSLFADYLFEQKTGPGSLGAFIRKVMKPGMRFIHTPEYTDTSHEERQWELLYSELRHIWMADRQSIVALLMGNIQLKQNMYSEKIVTAWSRTLDRYFSSDRPGLQIPEKFQKGCVSSIEKGLKKNGVIPSHPFFDLCDDYTRAHEHLLSLYGSNHIHFKLKALSYVAEQLEKRKNEKGILFFDDLLNRLHGKLEHDPDGLLANQIRSSYSAALIDEFQDTDPVQYTIFSRIFAHGGGPLFMIGDPKQAIYGFRGADIFAYLKAVENASSAYTLGKNYRSDPELVNAVNTLFENVADPFVFPEIAFHPADADEKDSSERFVVEQGESWDNTPMTIMLLQAGEKEKNKNEANPVSRNTVAGEMARLLDLGKKGLARMGNRPVAPRDMAVLVRTNVEAKAMSDELNQWGIPSVIHDTGNVFQSHEAMELERVLTAVSHPGQSGFVKSALATDLLGIKALDLYHTDSEQEKFDRWTDIFRSYHVTWNRKGFIAMYHALVKEWSVKSRLMAIGDGHRRNTNLAHLAQLLHQKDMETKNGPSGLLIWFREQMASPEEVEEHQLRLEQDAEAVTIVTIHKSKGMEYPIVFLPFAWNHVSRKDTDVCVFHDPDDRKLTCDLGSGQMDFNRASAQREDFAESLRVLYVALTRAKKRCVVVWGRVKDSHQAAFARLVYKDLEKPLDDNQMIQCLKDIETKSKGLVVSVNAETRTPSKIIADDVPEQDLKLSKWKGLIENDYRIVSFSSLSSRKGQGTEAEAKDRDREILKTDPEAGRPDTLGILTFPRGSAPGTFLHDIFEHTDFIWGEQEITDLVTRKLDTYGYEPLWIKPVVDMVLDVLKTPLDPADRSFTLSSIGTSDRLNELEFYYPLNMIRSESLSKVFRDHRGDGPMIDGSALSSDRFEFQPVKGFMKGFVDLIFRRKTNGVDRYYILDWKSNSLGYSKEDYTQENLERVMVKERYDLQYHLYALALHKYLMLKLGDQYDYRTHFGGVFYIFLRGVKPEDNGHYGIFRDTPDHDFIADLSRILWGE
ncbi:MAG: exodeoxyribonuclease V subunit beta [Desulfobacteraceae bacterium]|jgi:exodeoxyribonuclease V beta subunit